MVRKPWQEKSYRDAHELLEMELIKAMDGLTKKQLHERTRLSRVTVDRHLKTLMEEGKAERVGRLFFWSQNRMIQLERYDLIFGIMRRQEEIEHNFKHEIDEARETLTGEDLRKGLDEIYRKELRFRAQLLREMRKHGVTGTEEKETLLKKGIDMMQQLERTSSFEKREAIIRRMSTELKRNQKKS